MQPSLSQYCQYGFTHDWHLLQIRLKSYPENERGYGENAGIVIVGAGHSRCEFGANGQPDDQRAEEQHDEDAEQPLRDGGRGSFHVGKAEYARDHAITKKIKAHFSIGNAP